MVLVNHINGYLLICIDFHDLNKVFPKDEFPLMNIDILIDNIVGYEMLSLMDNFSS